jgi:putative ABC transport system ATP-binding protein
MGSSGSGKSTLLNIIGMLDTHDSGTYILDGFEIDNLTEKKAAIYRNKFLGFIFQSYNLINFKNVVENVALPLYYQKIGRSKRNEIALKYLDRVGLVPWSKHMPNELSGGQKQRVAIARAMASQPKLLLADEPTGALDSVTSQEIMKMIQEINDDGKTILMVTHEDDIAKMCKRIVRLKDGVIMEDTRINQVRA